MTENTTSELKPLWLSMEGLIADLNAQDLEPGNREATVRTLAGKLDEAGYNVSLHAGNILQLRSALNERATAGHALLDDFNGAMAALQLDDVTEPKIAAAKLATQIGATFPLFGGLDRRRDIEAMMVQTRLELLVARARELGGEEGIRYLIGAKVAVETLCAALDITVADHDAVVAKIAAERAERKRVTDLLSAVADKSDSDKIRHLIDNDVADDLMIELAGVDQTAIEAEKQALAEELAEKKRLAEEEAARKKAEAEGPSLDGISDDDMLEHIEAIREIREFSDVPDEIRMMCEQSNIPKCLIDIAINEPDKLDELESNAGG